MDRAKNVSVFNKTAFNIQKESTIPRRQANTITAAVQTLDWASRLLIQIQNQHKILCLHVKDKITPV